MNPGLVLQSVAAGCLHLLTRSEAFLFPRILNREYVVGARDLDAKMRQRTASVKGNLVQSEIQRRVCHVELSVTDPDLARFDTEHFLVELNALFNVTDVDRKMSFQSINACVGRIVHSTGCLLFLITITLLHNYILKDMLL